MLKYFFEKSLFYQGILAPLGNNIVPKVKEDSNFYIGISSNIRKENRIDEYSLKVDGRIIAYERKRKDICKGMEFRCFGNLSNREIAMIQDDINYETLIEILDDNVLEIETTAEVERTKTGFIYNRQLLRDCIFLYPHEDGIFQIKIRETFMKIDENKLIHFSSNSDLVEEYKIPENYKLTDGIPNSVSKIYDKKEFPELSQIIELKKNLNN